MDQNFINQLINGRTTVKVIVTNGFQLRGRIVDQSDKAIIIRRGDKVERLIYKHAISTIEPAAE